MNMAATLEREIAEPEIRRTEAFEAYALFRSLPPLLLRPPVDKKTGIRSTPREFSLSLGIDDEITLALIDLKTQKNFAAKYGVAEQTLVRWNKQLEGKTGLNDLQGWARLLLQNVIFALYIQIMHGKAQPGHYKLWFQAIAGWDERHEVVSSKRVIKTIRYEIVSPARH